MTTPARSTIETRPILLVQNRTPEDFTSGNAPYWVQFPDALQSDQSARFKTARIDMVFKALSTPDEWSKISDAYHGITRVNGVRHYDTPGVAVNLIIGLTYRVPGVRITDSLHPLEYTFDGPQLAYDDDKGRERHPNGVPCPARQSFRIEVTLSDAVKAIIREKAHSVRVYLDGDVKRED